MTADVRPDLLSTAAAALARGREAYAPDVRYRAPRRGLEIVGREAVVAHVAREAAAMLQPDCHLVRRSQGRETRAVEESVIRFVYSGDGIAGLDAPAGARVELGRVRVLELGGGLIVAETCIETWSRLPPRNGACAHGAVGDGEPAHGSPAPAGMAPRGRFADPG